MIDCPVQIETINMSYGDFMLMRNPNNTYSIWFREKGMFGLHAGKKQFETELSARQFLNKIMFKRFYLDDL